MGDKRGQQTMWGDLTGAQSALLSTAGRSRSNGGRRGRKSRTRTTGTRRKRSKRAGPRRSAARRGKGQRLLKGSAAAKRHMAKLRRMRRK